MTRYSFSTVALNEDLLSTPFEIQTNWYVLTGAACCGKSTMIERLADQGIQVVPESARQYFDMELAKGRTVEEIRQDGASLQRGIVALQLSYEERAQPSMLTFLDRAMPDSLTFFRVFGSDPNEILPQCFRYRYAGVFILDRLPFLRDQALGPEDDTASSFIDDWLARDYEALGYLVVRVPVYPPEERLAFILERLSTAGFGGHSSLHQDIIKKAKITDNRPR
jgi:predicted ATPase